MIMKLQKEEIKKEENKNTSNCLLWFLTVTCIFLLLLLMGSAYLLYSCSEIREYFKEKYTATLDDDEIKLQLYLLESNYYLVNIDKEETKLSSVAKDYKTATRYASKIEPNCVKQIMPQDFEIKEYKNIETMAENSIKYFKQILSNWNENIDYMDIDNTLTHLLKQYQDIYFNPGDWKEEKIDKRWKQLKDFYDGIIYELEKCTIPYNIPQEDLDKLQFIKEQISNAEEELDEKLGKLRKLDEELIKKVNIIIPINVQCLYNFPQKWSLIQNEEAIAEREIQVIKFKLKQIRYKLMIADTKEKFDYLVNWEDNFSKTKKDRYKFNIDSHYEKAEKLRRDLLNNINNCSRNE